MYGEYYVDAANPNIPSWRMVRTATTKYVQTYNATGAVIAREYYDLTNDPAENTNLLGDSSTTNDPSGQHGHGPRRPTQRLRHLRRPGLRPIAQPQSTPAAGAAGANVRQAHIRNELPSPMRPARTGTSNATCSARLRASVVDAQDLVLDVVGLLGEQLVSWVLLMTWASSSSTVGDLLPAASGGMTVL